MPYCALIPPREIAAITFTEFAAGELRERIAQYLDEMFRVEPEELRIAFPDGPAKEEREALAEARRQLDELTCTTIHGFCHTLLRTYAVEAAIDPGADILTRPGRSRVSDDFRTLAARSA